MLSKRYKKATGETLEQLANDIAAGAKTTASLKKRKKLFRTQLSSVEEALESVGKSLNKSHLRLRELESLQLAFTRIVRAQVK